MTFSDKDWDASMGRWHDAQEIVGLTFQEWWKQYPKLGDYQPSKTVVDAFKAGRESMKRSLLARHNQEGGALWMFETLEEIEP